MTTIINTHDMNSVLGIGEKVIYIYEGHKEWEGTVSYTHLDVYKRQVMRIFICIFVARIVI